MFRLAFARLPATFTGQRAGGAADGEPGFTPVPGGCHTPRAGPVCRCGHRLGLR
jgi:hypothetical protein